MAEPGFLDTFEAYLASQALERHQSVKLGLISIGERAILAKIALQWGFSDRIDCGLEKAAPHLRLPAMFGLLLDYRVFLDNNPLPASFAACRKKLLGILLCSFEWAHGRLHEDMGHRHFGGIPLLPRALFNTCGMRNALAQEIAELEASGERSRVLALLSRLADSCLFPANCFPSGKSALLIRSISKLPPDPGFREGLVYALEKPRRYCEKCGKKVLPKIDASQFRPKHGYMFRCPVCGAQFGYGGQIKPLVNKDGARVLSSRFSARGLDADTCQFCGISRATLQMMGDNLQVHHILPVCEGGIDDPRNLMVLCPWCHTEAHRRRKFTREILAAGIRLANERNEPESR